VIRIRVSEPFRIFINDRARLKAFNRRKRALMFRSVTELRLAFWYIWNADAWDRFPVQTERVLGELAWYLQERGESWEAIVNPVF